jgi:DNA-binding transcriptional regulator YiaG
MTDMPAKTLHDFTKRIDCPRCGCKNAERVIDGQKIRLAREDAGFSLREMARRMGISQQFLSDMEMGRRNFSEDRARQFLAALSGG